MKYYIQHENGLVTQTMRSPDDQPGFIEVPYLPKREGAQELLWDGKNLTLSVRPSRYHAWAGEWVFRIDYFMAEVRAIRTRSFEATKWVRERAADSGVHPPQDWLDYWQALRDITNQPVDPDNLDAFVWPTQPRI